jgi:formiminoglutamase
MNAHEWLARDLPDHPHISLLGAPVSSASISPSQAWSTPPAFREALRRFPTWDAEHAVDVSALSIRDCGDVADDREDRDIDAARHRIHDACTAAGARGGMVAVIGGDNSITVPVMRALMATHAQERWGLITLDAHHDCRPLDGGPSNGTPVRELIEGGLPGTSVAQIAIHPLGNQQEHARWAREHGVHVVPVQRVRETGVQAAVDDVRRALQLGGVTAVHVDFDIDCADRSAAPACPASLPGGLAAGDLLRLAHLLGRDAPAAGADITEVDANADVAGITVRLAAAVFLGFCAGLAHRLRGARAG